jgi:hypothetical protein
MATGKEALAASSALTITLNSLATSATVGRASTAVDNSSNLYLDALIEVTLALTTGTIGSDKAVYVYGYGSVDGTNYSEAVTGSDAGYTIDNPSGLPLLGVVPFAAQSLTRRSRPLSVAAGFGGVLPLKWGIVVVNFTGIALAGSGNSAAFNGLSVTMV